jgi:hypothetical protein
MEQIRALEISLMAAISDLLPLNKPKIHQKCAEIGVKD